MASTALAFALAGLGGFNAHGAGFLQAARNNGVEPDLVTATSGQIVVVAAYLSGEPDLRKGLIDVSLEHDPFAQLRIALFGLPGTFEPALGEAIERLLKPPYFGTSIDYFADRLLPAQLYKPTRNMQTLESLADTLNASPVGVLFNTYNPSLGTGFLYGNDAARDRVMTAPSLDVLHDQKSRDPRLSKPGGKEQSIQPITAEAIKSALWLSFYGFAGLHGGQMDGAYMRSCVVSELHNFDQLIICRPLANGWRRDKLPKSVFDIED